MDCYFFSSLACILKINGEYVSPLCETPIFRKCKEGDFIEFLSPYNEYLPLNYIIGENSNLVNDFNTPFGKYISPERLTPYPKGYSKLFSQNFISNTVNLTVILDGGAKLFMQNANSFKIENLPFLPTDIEVLFENNRYIALLFNQNHARTYVYDSAVNDLLAREIGQATFDGRLKITRQTSTLLSHEITKTYADDFESFTRVVTRNKEGNFTNPVLFKYAFLECVSLRDEITDFMEDPSNCEKVYDFLEGFRLILPSPVKDYDFALIYEREVKFVKFTLNNNLISDIILD